jgi:hypothetical protein
MSPVHGNRGPITVVGTDGLNHQLNIDQNGNIGTQDVGVAASAPTTGNITTVDTSAGQHTPPTAGSAVTATGITQGGVMVQLLGAGSAATVSLEISDDAGVNWYPVCFSRPDNLLTLAAPVAVNPATGYLYYAYIGGCSQFRVRCSTWAAPSGNLAVTIVPTPNAQKNWPTAIMGNTGNVANVTTPGDGSPTGSDLWTYAQQSLFNGATWDRMRNNFATSILASASRTTTQTSADQNTFNARALVVTLSVTVAGTGSVAITINGKDANGIYYAVLAGIAVTANGISQYSVGPGLPATANVSANAPLPSTVQVVATAGNANPITYSVGANYSC